MTRLVLTCTCALVALAVAGCGVSVKNADRDSAARAADLGRQRDQQARRAAAQRRVNLPPRPRGVVEIDGETTESLTPAIVQRLRQTGSAVTVNIADQSPSVAFAAFCDGRLDGVESTRPVTAAEFQSCQANGVAPVQFVVDAESTVLATRGERDVGLDCLTLAKVREVFMAGSAIRRWSQVGGFDIPLHTTGPERQGDGSGYFTTRVLGVSPPSLSAYRADHRAFPTQGQVRETVIGREQDARDAQLGSKAGRDLRKLQNAIKDKRVEIRRDEAQVTLGRRDKRSGSRQARDRAKLARARRELRSLNRDIGPATSFERKTSRARTAIQRSSGEVGIFSFAYYKLFEDQLRPIEIDAGTSPLHNCVFPSRVTVTSGAFPLARQRLITVSLATLRRPEVKAFLRAYLANAQTLATNAGQVALNSDQITRQQAWVEGRIAPPVVFYPPQPRKAAP